MHLPLVWAVLLSAVGLSLAQPNDFLLSGNPFLALVGWVPLFWALRRATNNRAAAGLGALFGLATGLLQDYWLAFFRDYAGWTLGGVAVGLALYGALLGPMLQVFLQRRAGWRPFGVGALWAVFEYAKGNGFLGFPWGQAPYPFHQWPWFFQIIDITGLSFLTFLIVSWNAWLAEALEPGLGEFRRSTGLFFAVALVGLAGYGTWRLNEPRPSRGSAQLALIQQNGDPWDSGDDLGPLQAAVKQSREALRAANPDLVVWSETSLRFTLQFYRPYFERNPWDSPLLKVVRSNRAWWLFGNPYAQDYPKETGYVNATVLMNPATQIVDYYGKIQQVPFAEYIPFWNVPAVKSVFQNLVGLQGSWDLGRQWTVFHVPLLGKAKSMAFATPICFEDAFPWVDATMVRAGAEVLINLTNDSWSRRDSSEMQHHVAALFRSVENRVYLVRSTNSGITSVIDPWGRIAAGPLPTFQAGHLIFDLPLARNRVLTPYTLFGDWLVAFFALVLVGDLVWTLRRKP
jgi:apolipoprotein N-acyltransferase